MRKGLKNEKMQNLTTGRFSGRGYEKKSSKGKYY